MNILIKLMSIVSLVIAPHIAVKTAETVGLINKPKTEQAAKVLKIENLNRNF